MENLRWDLKGSFVGLIFKNDGSYVFKGLFIIGLFGCFLFKRYVKLWICERVFLIICFVMNIWVWLILLINIIRFNEEKFSMGNSN